MRLTRVSLVLVLTTAACGGAAKPPVATEAKDSGVESFGEVNPADLAELDAGGPGKGSAGATASPASATTPAPPAPADDCTPVGIDFERRARPKMKDCYAIGKKKDPNLQGTVRIAVEIDSSGKVKGTKITEKTLPDPVAQCMLKVVKTTPLPEASKCPGKTLTIPMTFPTPP